MIIDVEAYSKVGIIPNNIWELTAFVSEVYSLISKYAFYDKRSWHRMGRY